MTHSGFPEDRGETAMLPGRPPARSIPSCQLGAIQKWPALKYATVAVAPVIRMGKARETDRETEPREWTPLPQSEWSTGSEPCK